MFAARRLRVLAISAFGIVATTVHSTMACSQTDDIHISGKAFLAWVEDNAIEFDTLDWQSIDLDRLSILDRLLEGKRVVYLGEPDHYVREKYDFRLIFIRYLFERGWRHIGMEMGRADGKRVEEYLQTGDPACLDRVATLGYEGDQRADRRHTLRGINREANPEFWSRAWAEHRWFLRQLRSLNEASPQGALRLHWFGYDVDTRPGGGYADARELLDPYRSTSLIQDILRRLTRVDGESRAEEIDRLESLLVFLKANETEVRTRLGADVARELRRTLRCLADGFAFLLSARDGLGSPEGTAGLRRREQRMRSYMDEILEDLAPTDKIILLGHNMHLSKDSGSLRSGPVDSGAPPMWPSIGSHVVERLPGRVYSIWMLYDHGRHAKLMMETIIEKDVTSNPYVVEHILARAGSTFFLPFHTGDPRESYVLRPHDFLMNGRPVGGVIRNQADAICFVAEVHEPGWQREEGS